MPGLLDDRFPKQTAKSDLDLAILRNSISNSLEQARRSADNLLATAQQSSHNLRREAEAKLKSIQKFTSDGADASSATTVLPSLAPTVRMSRSRASPVLRRGWSVTQLHTAPAVTSVPHSSSDGELSRIFRLSSVVAQGQADHHAAATAARSIDAVAQTLRQVPITALATAQETMHNCQANLQSLGTIISRNISQTTITLMQQRGTLAPGAMSPPRPGAWLLPFMTEAERKSIEASLGPFQTHAEKRKRRQADSSLREAGRHVSIVTTASLPWMTGTAVNPLLRAAYLARDGTRQVTLMIPWLAKSDQEMIFPNSITFDEPEEQEHFVRDWVRNRTGFEGNFNIKFYPGRYAPEKCSILPVGDPTMYIPDDEADVALLEEPEHLTWFHHGRRWTDKFNHVVGIMHTNYLSYAQQEEGGELKAALLKHLNDVLCRVHCHKVVKLSDAVQQLPRQTTEFVHGVPDTFLAVGDGKAKLREQGQTPFTKGAYFLGKVLMAKGYQELLELVTEHQERGSAPLHVDCYGTGEDLGRVRQEASRRKLDLSFQGARDHLDASLHDYKVFINPSTSDVVATTTAEALAMGKWVVCADLPCNKFFATFRNCLMYHTPEEFSEKVQYALSHDPAPMGEAERRRLTWEDATERLLDVAALAATERPGPVESLIDNAWWLTHNTAAGLEFVRVMTGAGANTLAAPSCLMDYDPSTANVNGFGGVFDSRARGRQTVLAK